MADNGRVSTVKKRFGGYLRGQTKAVSTERVQKNLTLVVRDAMRMKQLAMRDEISQARLIGRALDAYEEAYGRLVS